MARVVVAIDAGTTGVRALAVDEQARVADVAYRELTQHFPRPGWVEHDPAEIWDAVRATLAEVGGRLAERGRHRSPPSASPTSARRSSPSTARPDGRCTAPSCGRTAAPPRCAPSCTEAGHLPLVRGHDRPRARSVLQRHQGRLAAAPRRARARARTIPTSPSARSTPGSCGTSPAGPAAASTPPTPPTPAAPSCSIRPRSPGPPSSATSSACPPHTLARGAPVGGPLRHRRARRPRPGVRRRSTASRSRACSATSRPRCSGRPASSRAW